MPRRPLAVATLISLALCLATAALWTCALLVAPPGGSGAVIVRKYPDHSHTLAGLSRSGWVYLARNYPHPQGPAFRGPNALRSRPSPSSWSLPGLRDQRWEIPEPKPDGTVTLHLTNELTQLHLAWPLLLTAILPALHARRLLLARRAHTRATAGLCPACGYDLRASPTRCPECGRTPTTPLAPVPVLTPAVPRERTNAHNPDATRP